MSKKNGNSINIYARLRKIMPWEGDILSCAFEGQNKVINKNGKRKNSYKFSKVFNPNHTNIQVFNDCVKPMLNHVLNGFNAIFMAYGQTGSGKTFSILGKLDNGQKVPGLLILSLQYLLNAANVDRVEISAVETFGFNPKKVLLYDLALKDNMVEEWDKKVGSTTLKTKNATKILLNNDNIISVIKKLHDASHFAPTGKNPESSRGHTCYIASVYLKDNDTTNSFMKKMNIESGDDSPLLTHFIIVDLAGSEGESALTSDFIKTAEQSEIIARRLEASCINHGLSQLQIIFKELQKSKQKRSSSQGNGLKRTLNEFINNKSYISVLFTISPSIDNSKSTESTLRFAESCALIKCVPVKQKKKINKDKIIIELKKYCEQQSNIIDEQTKQINELEKELQNKENEITLNKSSKNILNEMANKNKNIQKNKHKRRYSVANTLNIIKPNSLRDNIFENLNLLDKSSNNVDINENNDSNDDDDDEWKVNSSYKISEDESKQISMNMNKQMSHKRRQSRTINVDDILILHKRLNSNSPLFGVQQAIEETNNEGDVDETSTIHSDCNTSSVHIVNTDDEHDDTNYANTNNINNNVAGNNNNNNGANNQERISDNDEKINETNRDNDKFKQIMTSIDTETNNSIDLNDINVDNLSKQNLIKLCKLLNKQNQNNANYINNINSTNTFMHRNSYTDNNKTRSRSNILEDSDDETYLGDTDNLKGIQMNVNLGYNEDESDSENKDNLVRVRSQKRCCDNCIIL